MALCNWLLTFRERRRTVSRATGGDIMIAPSNLPSSSRTSKAQRQSDFKRLRQRIDDADDYDFRDILRRKEKTGFCKWHLDTDGNSDAIRIARNFHRNQGQSKLSSNIIDAVDTVEEMVSKLTFSADEWKRIKSCFKQAREKRSLLPIIEVYTKSQRFSTRLNKYLAANMYHTLRFYCTILNCPTLARTQEYADTFTSILFHPELERYTVRQATLYRGAVFKDKRFVETYKKSATIITTTVLSTSIDYDVAKIYAASSSEDDISIIWIYKIKNTRRRTALDLREISQHTDEEEILIVPCIPFTVTSVEEMDNGRQITIYLNECQDE